jgi:plasmid maintenance system antidote protein VapI
LAQLSYRLLTLDSSIATLNLNSGSVAMALKLSAACDTPPESWLELENQYDLWQESTRIKMSDMPL